MAWLAKIIGDIRYGLQWDEPLIAYVPPAWFYTIKRWTHARKKVDVFRSVR